MLLLLDFSPALLFTFVFVIAVFVIESLITEGTVVGEGAGEMYVLDMFVQICLLCRCLSTDGATPLQFSILNSIRREVCAYNIRKDGF